MLLQSWEIIPLQLPNIFITVPVHPLPLLKRSPGHMFLWYRQLPTNLSEWNLKYCYLVLGAISPGLENDHTSFEELQRDLFLVIWDFQHTSLWLKSPITWYFFPFITDKSSGSSSPLNGNPWSVILFTGTTHSPLTKSPPTLIVTALISLHLTLNGSWSLFLSLSTFSLGHTLLLTHRL